MTGVETGFSFKTGELTAAGFCAEMGQELARHNALSLTTAAEAYARVGMAVHDAFIACWDTKYVYNLQRPETYINEHIDPAWRPYITTPGFPSYHLGHSTQSGAAATVLTDMFGRMSFTDTTHTDHGLGCRRHPEPSTPSTRRRQLPSVSLGSHRRHPTRSGASPSQNSTALR